MKFKEALEVVTRESWRLKRGTVWFFDEGVVYPCSKDALHKAARRIIISQIRMRFYGLKNHVKDGTWNAEFLVCRDLLKNE